MSKPRLALILSADVMLVVVMVMMLQIDKMVNGTLYSYGLFFSNDWAQPYLLTFRVCLILIVIAIFLITIVELPSPLFEKDE